MSITLATAHDVIAVPTSAVHYQGSATYVDVLQATASRSRHDGQSRRRRPRTDRGRVRPEGRPAGGPRRPQRGRAEQQHDADRPHRLRRPASVAAGGFGVDSAAPGGGVAAPIRRSLTGRSQRRSHLAATVEFRQRRRRGAGDDRRRSAATERPATRDATGPPVLDVVVPVHNEQASLERSIRRLHAYLTESVPVRLAHHHRRQRKHRRHLGNRLPARRRTLSGVRLVRVNAEGSRPGAADGMGEQRRGRPRLHGRRSVDRPRRVAAARRAADVRSQRPRDRHPAGAWLAGHPRTRSAR